MNHAVFGLTADRWARLRALLDEALALSDAQRSTWLAALGGGDADLEPSLNALLAQRPGDAGGTLLDALPRLETGDFAGAPGDAVDASIGPYRLIRRVGRGGMASVWLAERTDLLQSRQVALKLPHGSRDGWRSAHDDRLAERLAREREILATLEHPNIARLYDAGTASDGRPWLAMEYVRGERIDVHAADHAADTAARLRLFLQVTAGVAHAHARLVVHRDIKPANILVTEDGVVKLLDFGIAKLLSSTQTGGSDLTHDGGRALTPPYAAPEQITGQPLTVAADIYALGVVLCELLSGQRPYRLQRGSAAELEEAILSAEPVAPSALAADRATSRALRGDLDAIVLKALKKSPAERYASVDALADDIRRHLSHQPVVAQPDRWAYRLRKLWQRRRGWVLAGTGVAASLAVGSGLALWQAHQATQAQAQAEQRAEEAERARRLANAQVVLSDFIASDLTAERSSTELQARLERALTMVRTQYGAAAQALPRAHLIAHIAGQFRRLGQFERWRAITGEAEAAAREAGDRLLVAELACNRGRDVAQSGDLAAASALVGAQLAVLERLQPLPQSQLSACLADASAVARLAGDGREAIRTAERIRDLEVSTGTAHGASFADTLLILSRAYGMHGRFADADAAAREGLAILHKHGYGGGRAAINLSTLRAGALREGGRPREAVALLQSLLDAHATRGGATAAVASLRWNHALALHRADRAAEAAAALQAALPDAVALGDRPLVRAISVALVGALAAAGDVAAARQALASTELLYAKQRAERSYTFRLFALAAAELALATRDHAAAERSIADAEAALRRADDQDPTHRAVQVLRARLSLMTAQPQVALAATERALGMAQRQSIDPAASSLVGEVLSLRARVKAALGDKTGASTDAAVAGQHFDLAGGGANEPQRSEVMPAQHGR